MGGIGLTRRMSDALRAITHHVAAEGAMPSRRQLAAMLECQPNNANRLMHCLVERGEVHAASPGGGIGGFRRGGRIGSPAAGGREAAGVVLPRQRRRCCRRRRGCGDAPRRCPRRYRAMSDRHRWGDPQRFPHKTERVGLKCGMVKVTRHESEGPRDIHFQEFWRGLDQIVTDKTPPCEVQAEQVSACTEGPT